MDWARARAAAQRQLADARSRLAAAEEELAAAQTALRRAERRFGTADGRVARAEQALDAAAAERDQARRERYTARRAYDRATVTVGRLERRIRDAAARLDRLPPLATPHPRRGHAQATQPVGSDRCRARVCGRGEAMVMPLWGRVLAAVAGGLLVLAAGASVTGTLIVPRQVTSWLTRWVDRAVTAVFRAVATAAGGYKRRDKVLTWEAAAILLAQLAAWLGTSFLGYWLLFWPFSPTGLGKAFTEAGSSMFTLGFAEPTGPAPAVIVFAAAATGLVIVTLQIAYLPTLYGAFNRRENEVALLNARAGVPAWGPEMLARTHYALGSGVSTLDTMAEFYERWERWAADVTESHTTYLPLVRFRSPRPLSSWVTALLAVLDSAALQLSLSPKTAPEVPARLCLRSGFLCFRQVARAMGFEVTDEPDPAGQISLTYEQFLEAVARLREVDFPIERDPVQAWPDFVGWRLNYEQAAYTLTASLDVVPALWSGPRLRPTKEIAPIRPPLGRVRK